MIPGQGAKGFPSGAAVKNLPASAGDERDLSSIPGAGRSPEDGNGDPVYWIHSSILAWEIPGTEEPGGLQAMGS